MFEDTLAIEAVCDDFDRQWQAGPMPRIDDFIDRVRPDLVGRLHAELHRIDSHYRTQAALPDTCAPLARDLADVPDHRQIGDYALESQIGSGSFGTVWKAWHPALRRHDAIKLPLFQLDDSEQVATFHHEARSAAQLDHPNIVRVVGFGESGDRAYIVFELVEGVTLKEWSLSQDPGRTSIVTVASRISDAISHAHDLGIVHRDLKPGNILVDHGGQPHITDFGLAKNLDAESTIAADGALIGTVPYMSPEQVSGDNRTIGPASDIYALGVILYEMLTGALPFDGDRLAIIHGIQSRRPALLKSHDSSIATDLQTICLKAMEKDPADRYDTAADLRDDLLRYQRGEQIHARRYTVLDRSWRWIRKHPVAALIALTLLTLVTLAIVVYAHPATHGMKPVTIETAPPGASVQMRRLDTDTFEFVDGEPVIDASATPTTVWAPPGLYAVTAHRDDKSTYVHRRVPDSPGLLPPAEIWPALRLWPTDGQRPTIDTSFAGSVTDFIDGETLAVAVKDGGQRLVKLHGIACPEPLREPFHRPGIDSWVAVIMSAIGKKVRIASYGVDDGNYTHGEVFIGDQSVSSDLVRAGKFWHDTKSCPNRRDLAAAERHAISEGLGMWGADVDPNSHSRHFGHSGSTGVITW